MSLVLGFVRERVVGPQHRSVDGEKLARVGVAEEADPFARIANGEGFDLQNGAGRSSRIDEGVVGDLGLPGAREVVERWAEG